MTDSPSSLIDAKIASIADWRGGMLARIRTCTTGLGFGERFSL